MIGTCRRIAENAVFQFMIVGVIVVNAAVLGLETSIRFTESYGAQLRLLNGMATAIFLLELAIRILACWPRPISFFRNGWNVFDFAVIAAAFLPANGGFATVGRLLRLLRVTRLVSVFPNLRLIINTMLLSIPSMGHVVLLLSLLLYVYGIAGVHLFRDIDPLRWGTLSSALLSLFQVVTLEGWADMQLAILPQFPGAWIYFSSFIVVAVFVVINLFIAVVINNLEDARAKEHQASDSASDHKDILELISDLRGRLTDLEILARKKR